MFVTTGASKGSNPHITEFILMCFLGIHCWQHWLSLPLALLYHSVLLANAMILLIIRQEMVLHQLMFYFLAILALVDAGLSTSTRILARLWFNACTISLSECFFQIYAIHVIVRLVSGIFLCMAIDRYVAISTPSVTPLSITEGFVLKATLFMVFKIDLLAVLVTVLDTRHHYCSRNEIDHCLCSKLSVTNLACDDRKANSIFWLTMACFLLCSDVGLIIVFYTLILWAVLKSHLAKVASKALSTCSSHIILILFFYAAVATLLITHTAKRKLPLIPVLLNVLHCVISLALNPIVYALRTQEIKVGILKLIRMAGTRK
ncbi:putative olfactory receptor 56B2 [Tachyglossus aculeatus]|uniref:putative olfactory receptor 56B2 n=1 Tax=Tachyglossus aculeatus TaxID=9261 RepID=UPI0018F506D1|nr:putative olfactory receptor 56B2 [Tachyglossus aculeatus]